MMEKLIYSFLFWIILFCILVYCTSKPQYGHLYGEAFQVSISDDMFRIPTTTPVSKLRRIKVTLATTRRPRFDARGQLVRAQKSVVCSELNFAPLAGCCKTHPGPFFNTSSLYQCNNRDQNDKLFALSREYVLNKMQDPRVNNTLNFYSNITKKAVTGQACFSSCLFRSKRLIENDRMDYARIQLYFISTVTKPWQPVMASCVDSCIDLLSEAPPMEVIVPQRGFNNLICDLKPFVLMQCVRKYLLMVRAVQSCVEHGALLQTSTCKNLYTNMKSCDLFPTSKKKNNLNNNRIFGINLPQLFT